MKIICLVIFSIILGLCAHAGLICLLIGAIDFMITGVANSVLLWTGFWLFIIGKILSGINIKTE